MHTYLMTGVTSGIGRHTLDDVLERDPEAHIALLARRNSGTTTLAQLGTRAKRVSLFETDLDSLAQVNANANAVAALVDRGELPPLRGILANAGVSLNSAEQTSAEGYERTFAVNVLAVDLLLRTLRSQLTPGSRVVLTTSDTHFGDFRHSGGTMPAPRWLTPEKLAQPGNLSDAANVQGGRLAYTTSKLGVIYLAHAWARVLPKGVEVVSYNPGLVPGTGLSREASPVARFLMNSTVALSYLGILDRPQAAGHKLANALLRTTRARSGDYVDRTRPIKSSVESYNEQRETALWNFAEKVAKELTDTDRQA